MGLRIFPVVGEALNFGGRRMATIMRVAWLPVVLLLIVYMATVFAYLSVISGRVITFADVGTYFNAQSALARLWASGWDKHAAPMAGITAGYFILQAILLSSFMAPLIRYAGLGEKPALGLVRLAFGPDQLRYIFSGLLSLLFVVLIVLAPITVASAYTLKYVIAAISETMASFPDPESLHTIDLVTVGDTLVKNGAAWIVRLAIPLAAAAPFGFILWLVAFVHFHPRNRPAAPERRAPFLRAIATLAGVAGVAGVAFFLIRQQIVTFIKSAATVGANAVPDISGAPQNAVLFVGVAAYLLVAYFNLRLFAYPGLAVCRKSMALGDTLRVTRGWDLIRLQVILIFIAVILFVVQTYFINYGLFRMILPTIFERLLELTKVTTRLVNSGETATWVQPVFVWAWNGLKILINIFWIFFSYGVAAGLYGRLYRDSEAER